jgi:hypothetical protein
METADRSPIIGTVPVTKEPRNHHRPTEAKAGVVRAWAPQSSPLTREEIRKQVIDQIG